MGTSATQSGAHATPAPWVAKLRTLPALEHLELALLHHVELACAQSGVALLDQDLPGLRGSTSLARTLHPTPRTLHQDPARMHGTLSLGLHPMPYTLHLCPLHCEVARLCASTSVALVLSCSPIVGS